MFDYYALKDLNNLSKCIIDSKNEGMLFSGSGSLDILFNNQQHKEKLISYIRSIGEHNQINIDPDFFIDSYEMNVLKIELNQFGLSLWVFSAYDSPCFYDNVVLLKELEELVTTIKLLT